MFRPALNESKLNELIKLSGAFWELESRLTTLHHCYLNVLITARRFLSPPLARLYSACAAATHTPAFN